MSKQNAFHDNTVAKNIFERFVPQTLDVCDWLFHKSVRSFTYIGSAYYCTDLDINKVGADLEVLILSINTNLRLILLIRIMHIYGSV